MPDQAAIQDRFKGGWKIEGSIKKWNNHRSPEGEPDEIADVGTHYYYPNGDEITDPAEQAAFDRHVVATIIMEAQHGK